MARSTRLVLAATAFLLVVTGYCLWRPAQAPSGRPASVTARGGSLTGSLRSEPGNYLRYVEATAQGQVVTNLIDARLVRLDRVTDTVEPGLAESWSVSDDGLTYTFLLRDGVLFSDGTPLTSADVAFSARVLYDPAVASAVGQATLIEGQPLRFAATHPRTVVVTLPSRFAPGIRLLENLPIVPKHKLEAALANGTLKTVWSAGTPPSEVVGLGPFVLSEHTSGGRLVFRRNPHYWRKDAQGVALPYLDSLTLQILSDQNTEALRMTAGEIDFLSTSDPRPEDMAALKREEAAGRLRIIDAGVSLDPDFLWFSTVPLAGTKTRPWLHERAFRQAVSYAVDRQGLADGPYLGTAVPVHGPVSPGNKTWHSASAPQYPLDRARARELLASVGLTDANGDGMLEDASGSPARFSIITHAGHIRERSATFVQDQLRQSGLAVDIVSMDPRSLFGRFAAGDYDAIYFGVQASATDPALNPDFWMSSGAFHLWNPGQKTPATPWEAQIDDLMRRQAAAQTLAERQALFADVQRIMGEEVPAIYFVAPRVLVPVSARVGSVIPAVQAPQLLWAADTLSVAR